MLRYLTPAHVAQVVKSEVQTGERVCISLRRHCFLLNNAKLRQVCLNWEMTKLETPGEQTPDCETGPFLIPYRRV